MKKLLFVLFLFSANLVNSQWKLAYGNMPKFSPDLNLCFQSSGEQLGPRSIRWHLLQSTDYGITFNEALVDTSNALFSRGYFIKNDSNIYAYAPFISLIFHYKYPDFKQTDTINLYAIAEAQCKGCGLNSYYSASFIPLFVNTDTTIIILGKTWISTNKGTTKQFVPYNNHNFLGTISSSFTSYDYKKVSVLGKTFGYAHKIFRSNDYGKTWVDSVSLPSYIGYRMKFRGADTIFANDTNNNKLYSSTNGGHTWTKMFDVTNTIGINPQKDRTILEFYFTDLNHGILAIGDTSMYGTVDGGKSWHAQTIDPPFENDHGNQETAQDFVYVNDTLEYFTTSFYKTYRTGNMGGISPGGNGIKYNTKNVTPQVFNVFPNPAKNIVTIHLNNELQGEPTYTISNVLGQIIIQGKIKSTQSVINISKLTHGVYFINIGYEVVKLIVE